MSVVLEPLVHKDLLKIFDTKSMDIIKYFIFKALLSQPELLIGQKILPIHVPKEHIEQWLTQALTLRSIGAGSYPIDVYKSDYSWGADIKMLSISINSDGTVAPGESGETSLGQKFTGIGKELDSMFSNKQYEKIRLGWLNILKEKYSKLNSKLPLKKIYYFFILRSENTFHLAGCKLLLGNIDATETDIKRTTDTSVFLKYFIDDKFGNVKIYKSKKRLELRLIPKYWIENNYTIDFKTNFKLTEVDLRTQELDKNFVISNIETLLESVKLIKN